MAEYKLYLFCLFSIFFINKAKIVSLSNEDGPEIEQYPVNLHHYHQQRCQSPLGLESGDIRDDQISVSASLAGMHHGKENARLNSDHAWLTHTFPEPWIQINFSQPKLVSGVRTQGKAVPYKGGYLITSYQVQYTLTLHDKTWKTVSYGIRNKPHLFVANNDTSHIVTNMFYQPIQAHSIRIVPKTWPRHKNMIALRLELLGCSIAAESGCGGPRVLTNSSGTIASMNYPNNYSNNANCVWEVVAPHQQTIVLQIENFQLEPGNCLLEFVEIIDVIGDLEKTLDKLCEKSGPRKFFSTENQLKIRFVSDHFEYDIGFLARYHFVIGSKCGRPQALEDSGHIQTLNYPDNYDNDLRCVWDITVKPDKLVQIEFGDMRISGEEGRLNETTFCTGDKIEIFNTLRGNPLINDKPSVYCGRNIPEPFVSKGNTVRVVFQSDGHKTDRGFFATYKSVVASGCGGKRDLTSPEGIITSLNYSTNLLCEWRIMAKGEADIKITFHEFELEEDGDCRFDHISIYDGGKSHLLGTYCNNKQIHPLEAYSGTMLIVFKSDNINTARGFRASYVITPRTTPAITTTTSTTHKLTTTAAQETRMTTSKTMLSKTTRHLTTTLTTRLFLTMSNVTSINTRTNGQTKQMSTENIDKLPPFPTPTVTKEMAKWIMVGLASVSALLIVLVMVGFFLCCKQHVSGSTALLRESINNANNSSVMQNRAYDMSAQSTNHSVRSRQIEQPESSQVSESFSHQGTLRRVPSKESHIYFSIDDYNTQRNKEVLSHPPNKAQEIKVHFKKATNEPPSEHLGAMPSDEEMGDYDLYDEDVDSNFNNDDRNTESVSRSPQYINDSSQATTSPMGSSEQSGSKMMVNNILYESADSMDQDL